MQDHLDLLGPALLPLIEPIELGESARVVVLDLEKSRPRSNRCPDIESPSLVNLSDLRQDHGSLIEVVGILDAGFEDFDHPVPGAQLGHQRREIAEDLLIANIVLPGLRQGAEGETLISAPRLVNMGDLAEHAAARGSVVDEI